MQIKDRLTSLRKEHKLTQAKVAEYLNITDSAYGYYETGRNDISIDNAFKLCELYNVSISYLLCETNSRQVTAKKDDIVNLINHLIKIVSLDEVLLEGEILTSKSKEFTIDTLNYLTKYLSYLK